MSKRFYGSRRSRPASYNPNTPRTGDRPYVPVINQPTGDTPRPNPTEPPSRGIEPGADWQPNGQRNPLFNFLGKEFGQDTNNIKFQDVLRELGSGQTDISQLLASLLGSGNSEFPVERWDMLYQYLLGLMSQADQRGYDYKMLNESRQYNNPQNELARLMGAGVSRDAAIQLLSGSAGGSGVGSVIGSGANPFTAAPSGVSGTQELQRQQTISGIVFGALGTLSNLLQTGVSMAQGIEQVKQLNAQNYFSQQQVQAFDSVQQIASALQSMQTNGEIESADIEKLSNADDLIKFLKNAAKDNEQLSQLIQSPAYNRALGTSYGRDYFNQYWKSLRSSQTDGSILDEYINGLRFDNAAKQLQPELIGAEISSIGVKNKEMQQNIIESATRIAQGEAQIEVLNNQGKWIVSQITKTKQETANLETQGKMLLQNYEYNAAGFPVLKQNRIDELTLQSMRWNLYLRDPNYSKGALEQMQKAWLTEPANAADAAYVMSLYYNSVGNFAIEHPGLYQLGTCLHLSGLPELLKFSAGVASPPIAKPLLDMVQ